MRLFFGNYIDGETSHGKNNTKKCGACGMYCVLAALMAIVEIPQTRVHLMNL